MWDSHCNKKATMRIWGEFLYMVDDSFIEMTPAYLRPVLYGYVYNLSNIYLFCAGNNLASWTPQKNNIYIN